MADQLRIFHKVQVAHAALFRAADHRIRSRVGLSTSQLAVLFILARKDGLPISEVSRILSMGKSSLTGLVDRMCARGLVRRAPSERDGRITQLYLCAPGRALLAQGGAETRRFNAALLAPFSAHEQQVIDRFLTHLTENADSIINQPEARTDG
ncbi:MarR family winged helix-turn-helix transcriptional regulator [Pseudooceanicola aestuarii]|uniref:MarR family winged helix-turn-helix transcriptional regulator n=1 Tax=Pseudooceanicola aestuarii TaxID=2697319 RepID=UPI0013D36EF7|nr:MarR family transcriptional regulator [Pseudooceanicola aestuarii]